MKIHSLEIENIKRIRVARVTFSRVVTPVTGKNEAGKTSFLDAIPMLLGGKDAFTAAPVRRGAQFARIRGDLGEFIVTRKWNAAGVTDVIVESPEGARYPGPQKILDAIYGDLTFDAMAFDRMKPAEQFELLRKLVTLDVDVDALDRENATDFATRTDVNRRIKSLTERVETLRGGVVPDMDVTPVDLDALVATMQSASGHNAAIARERSRRADLGARAARLASEADTLQAEISRLQAKLAVTLDAHQAVLVEIADAAPLEEEIDTSVLAEQIRTAQRENSLKELQVRQRESHRAAADELAAARLEAENLTAAMEARTAEKEAAVARATMPVPGLSFGDGQVLFNGLPFSEASSAQRTRVSVGIGMAANPTLKLILIRDASLLDEDSWAIVEEEAKAKDYMVLMETVAKDARAGIHFVDGEVAAIDGVPVERVYLQCPVCHELTRDPADNTCINVDCRSNRPDAKARAKARVAATSEA